MCVVVLVDWMRGTSLAVDKDDKDKQLLATVNSLVFSRVAEGVVKLEGGRLQSMVREKAATAMWGGLYVKVISQTLVVVNADAVGLPLPRLVLFSCHATLKKIFLLVHVMPTS